jgi:hypothetical protein
MIIPVASIDELLVAVSAPIRFFSSVHPHVSLECLRLMRRECTLLALKLRGEMHMKDLYVETHTLETAEGTLTRWISAREPLKFVAEFLELLTFSLF